MTDQPKRRDRAIYWRCFHCGEAFSREQRKWAALHFGDDPGVFPVCQMRVPGEHHLLVALRKAHRELARFYAEDGDVTRAMYAMRADHAQALIQAEEAGYDKGVRDARAEKETPHD